MMNKKYTKIVTMLIAFWGVLFAQSCNSQPVDTKEKSIVDQVSPDLLSDIGEMLLVGFRGMDVKDCAHIERDIQKYHVGGVILFEYDAPSGKHVRNIKSPAQVRKLCADLQGLDTSLLLISIDQEGGMVNRLKSKYGFPKFASAKSTSLAGLDSVRYYASLTGRTLEDLGINLNFAPCVDVDVNPNCPVIGKLERSFSSNPQRVFECAEIWIKEQKRHHVLSCLKHFPGHGSSTKDSHKGIVDVSSTWIPSELEPYKRLVASSTVDMIMTTHVFNSQLDTLPATLSKKILTDLLRKEIGFSGVIITDDLAMGAMVNEYDFEVILEKSINAGADLLCLSNNGSSYDPDLVPKAVDQIIRLLDEGRIDVKRIHESAARIRALKKQLNNQ